jgi:integrase
MASLYSIARKTGKAWRIGVSDGEERTVISLGKMPKKSAELCLSMVEQIAAANAAGQSYSVEVATWTQNIGDELHAKLVNAGLLRQRQRRTLGTFIADYIAERSDWKARTAAGFSTSKKMMLDFFGKDAPIEKISVDDAVAFRLALEKEQYSEATIAKYIKHCRQVFNLAQRRKLITDSPFETVKGGSERNPERLYFVSVEETQAMLDACNSPKQRLIIALARWGGLRCPSELVGLKWSEINWERNRFIVHSPKTEGKGKAQRTVPIFKELYPFLREAFESAPEGIDRVYPEFTEKKSLGSFIEKTATRAGIVLWVKPFQNMRSIRATELIEEYPAHMVNAWLGHTEAVAMVHYRQTTGKAADKFFEQAAGENPDKKVTGKMTGEHAGMGCFGVESEKNVPVTFPTDSPVFQGYSSSCTEKQGLGENSPMAGAGPLPVSYFGIRRVTGGVPGIYGARFFNRTSYITRDCPCLAAIASQPT